jgi:hypothetical protein
MKTPEQTSNNLMESVIRRDTDYERRVVFVGLSTARKYATREEANEIVNSGQADYHTVIHFWAIGHLDDLEEAMEKVKIMRVKHTKTFQALVLKYIMRILDYPAVCWALAELKKVGPKIGSEMIKTISSRAYNPGKRGRHIGTVLSIREVECSVGDTTETSKLTVKYPTTLRHHHREIAKMCSRKQLCGLMGCMAIMCHDESPELLKTRTCAVLRATGQLG